MEFCKVLQYFKDGIVSVGYSSIHFYPLWVNSVRKPGTFFQGDLRRRPYLGGSDPYVLSPQDMEIVGLWMSILAQSPYKERMDATNLDLRLAIDRAGTYYEASHERTEAAERLISLAIALEALFSPADQGELRYRISQHAAMLLGRTSEERRKIFADISAMYSLRSKLVHGNFDITKYRAGAFVSEESLRLWASYLRRAILSYVILLLRGHDRRESILAKLADACFDDSVAERLRIDADEVRFLEEFVKRPGLCG